MSYLERYSCRAHANTTSVSVTLYLLSRPLRVKPSAGNRDGEGTDRSDQMRNQTGGGGGVGLGSEKNFLVVRLFQRFLLLVLWTHIDFIFFVCAYQYMLK